MKREVIRLLTDAEVTVLAPWFAKRAQLQNRLRDTEASLSALVAMAADGATDGVKFDAARRELYREIEEQK